MYQNIFFVYCDVIILCIFIFLTLDLIEIDCTTLFYLLCLFSSWLCSCVDLVYLFVLVLYLWLVIGLLSQHIKNRVVLGGGRIATINVFIYCLCSLVAEAVACTAVVLFECESVKDDGTQGKVCHFLWKNNLLYHRKLTRTQVIFENIRCLFCAKSCVVCDKVFLIFLYF